MKKYRVLFGTLALVLLLVGCGEVNRSYWDLTLEAPSITEDAFHIFQLRADETQYIGLGMTREEVQRVVDVGEAEPAVFPCWGVIGFDERDRVDTIFIRINMDQQCLIDDNIPPALLWGTPNGITLGSPWSELEERFDASYNLSSFSDRTVTIHFTRDHVPVHEDSGLWEYRSYYVAFVKSSSSDTIWGIDMRRRMR